MKNRINDKINEIERFLDELAEIIPQNLNEYNRNFEKKAACERYFEKIIESAIDLAFLTIKLKGFEMPEEDKKAFDILVKEKIIAEKLAERLKDAKGMRNIIAHEYGNTDDELVFHAIADEIEKDIKEFINSIEKIK